MRVRYSHDGMFAFMPWHVEADHPDCPSDTPYAVVKDDDGEVEGCHATEDDANAQVAALYANEPDAVADAAGLTADDAVMAAVYSAFGSLGAVGEHSTDTAEGTWDAAANEARLPSPMSEDTARAAYAWIEDGEVSDGEVTKQACRFIHHEVSTDGTPGAANMTGCSAGIAVLNGGRGGTTIPDADRQGVYDHLAAHLRDGGKEPPKLMSVDESAGDKAAVASPSNSATSPVTANTAGTIRLTRLNEAGQPTSWSSTFAMEVVPPPVNAEQPEPEFDPARYSKGLWRGVLCVEGVQTGDSPRREFAEGSLTWREPPLSIYWQKVTAEGHDNAFIVANAEELWRDPAIDVGDGTAPGVKAWGRFNLESDEAREVHSMIGRHFLRGISVTIDETQESDIEYVWPEPPAGDGEGAPTEEDLMMALFAMPEKVIFHRARIMDACLTGQPALPEAYVELVPDDAEAELTGERPDVVVTAGGGPVRPPTAWFQDPHLDGPTPGTFLENGRVYGHLATWGTCHLSFAPKVCVTPPHSGDYSAFRHGVVVTDEGDQVAVGQVTMGTVHAGTQLGLAPAIQHYEHTGWAVADVAIGEDRYGIWLAGALRPDVTEAQLRALRASGWSGDWRRDNRGRWHVAGALVVNVAGFPIPRTKAYSHDGEQVSLVASGMLLTRPSNVIPIGVADRIARSIGRDHPSRREALRARVHPSKE